VTSRRPGWSDDRYLSPIILQSLGAALVVASFVFWIITERQSSLMVSTAITLVGAGGLQGIRLRARDERQYEAEAKREEAAVIRREQDDAR
jgi:hypothetical protein